MIIEIRGVQFVNKGAELMLLAIIDKCSQLWPKADICLKPGRNSPYINRAKLGLFQKLNLRKNIFDLNRLTYFLPSKLRSYIKYHWGIVTEADVDLVLDASGFTYGEQWSLLMLRQVATEVTRLQRMNKKYIFMPQALGPFTTPEYKKWARKAFKSATLTFAREQESFDHVSALNHSINLEKSPDFTNLISAKLSSNYLKFKDKIVIVPNSKMLSDKNANRDWQNNYVTLLKDIVTIFQQQNEDVILLNHEGEADLKICEQVNQQLAKKIPIVEPNNSLQVKAIIGASKFVICSRYHGCVSAMSQGVPCLATSWSHKYEQLFAEYQQADMILSADITKDELQTLLLACLSDIESIKSSLQQPIANYKKQAEKMWEQIAQVVSNQK